MASSVAEASGAQRPPHPPELERGVHDEAGDEGPRPVEVPVVEGELERVVVVDVEDPGRELEHGAADEEEQAEPLEQVGERAQRRPGEQPRDDRPQLGQQHRHQRQPQQDVGALADPVDPARAGDPVEQVKGEDPVLRGRVVAGQPGVVGGPGDQPGDELDRYPHQEHGAEHRREPRAAQRTLPSQVQRGRSRQAARSGRNRAGDQR